MTTSTKIIIGVLVVAIAGGVWYQFKTDPEEKVQAENATTPISNNKKMAFADFIKNDSGSYKCTVNQSVGGIDVVGTVYVGDKMVSGSFTTTFNGQNFDSSFILRDGYSYGWTSMMPNVGYKVKINTDGATVGTSGASGSYSFNTQSVGDYNCEAWAKDESKFVVPTSVTFKVMN